MAALYRSNVPVQPRRLAHSHAITDQRNAEADRLIARRLRHDRCILTLARSNLRRWMLRDGKRVRPVFGKWQRLLGRLSASQLADFLVSDPPLSRRLRQSSPFAGPLPPVARKNRNRRA